MPTTFEKTFKTTKHDNIKTKKATSNIINNNNNLSSSKKRASARSTKQHQVVNSSTLQCTSDTT